MEIAGQPPGFLSFKVMFVGAEGVGKTSLIFMLMHFQFKENHLHTVGTEFRGSCWPNPRSRLGLIDTSGKAKYRPAVQALAPLVQLFVIVFDVSDRQSYEKLPELLKDVQGFGHRNSVYLLVSNKHDREKPAVSTDEAMNFAISNSMMYFETNAEDYENCGAFLAKLGEAADKHSFSD